MPDDEELTDLYRREGVLFAPVGVDPTPVLDALVRAGDNSDALRHFNERDRRHAWISGRCWRTCGRRRS